MLKTKTKKKVKKRLKLLSKQTTRLGKQAQRLSKRKVTKKSTSRKVLGGFQTAVLLVTGLSLYFTMAAAKPADPKTYANPSIVAQSKQTKANATKQQSITRSLPAAGASGNAEQSGTASWYALGLPSPDSHTCASTKYPRGSYLLVTNLRNGRSVVCLVNDYGPQAWTKRVIDLSRGSFREIDNLGSGLAPVEVRLTKPPASRIELTKAILGYQLCYQRFSPEYCEAIRYLRLPVK